MEKGAWILDRFKIDVRYILYRFGIDVHPNVVKMASDTSKWGHNGVGYIKMSSK